MRTLLLGMLQVILASGLLYAYYHFFLRNSRFHQYNRFYLLMAAVISIIIPFINIPVYFTSTANDPDAVWQVLRMMSGTEEGVVVTAAAGSVPVITWQQGLYSVYAIISLVLIARLVLSLRAIHRLIRRHPSENLGEDIRFVNTSEPDAPFSFFRWLFWNKNIDMAAPEGQQIFRHELFHIRQKHSYDVLFFEILTIAGWVNPFFHLMKKEVKTIHEFLADKFAAQETDKWAYAELLLMQALHTRQKLVNPFFQSQIKRRIAMITSSAQPAYQYLRKVLVLPVAATVITLFAFSYRERKNDPLPEPTNASTLSQAASDTTKPGEKITFQADRIYFEAARKGQPANGSPAKAVSLYIINGKKYSAAEFESAYGKEAVIESQEVVSYAANNPDALKLYGEAARGGVLVFKDATIARPVKVEEVKKPATVTLRGSLLEGNTPLFVIDGEVQEKSKGQLKLKEIKGEQIESITVLKDQSATEKYGEEAKDGVVEITTKKIQLKEVVMGVPVPAAGTDSATAKSNIVFLEVENTPSFKGGDREWRKFLERNINANIPVENHAPPGTYKVDVQFIVDKDGAVRNIKALTSHGYGMEEEAVRLLKNSPEWEPAKQNGKAVAMYRIQPVSFVVMDENQKSGELKEVTVTGYARPKSASAENLSGTIKEVTVEGYPMKDVSITGNLRLNEVVVVGYGKKKNEEAVAVVPANLPAIYPNPAGSSATISLTVQKAGEGVIRVADMNGTVLSVQKIALTQGTNNYTISTGGLSKGTYLVSVTAANDKTPVKAAKLIKN